MRGLTYNALREANIIRLPQFRDVTGAICHTKPDGSDWSVSDWVEATVGEIGEFCNWHKKFRRGDIDFQTYCQHARKELADVATYLDILAKRCLDIGHPCAPNHVPHAEGIDLGKAVIEKFNEVSIRVGANVFITFDGEVYTK